jgi:hypothetical protein
MTALQESQAGLRQAARDFVLEEEEYGEGSQHPHMIAATSRLNDAALKMAEQQAEERRRQLAK